MRALVTGAAGQLGRAIVERFSSSMTVLPLGRADLDVTSEADVRRAVDTARPDVVVNCSAYNAVDEAQQRAAEALEVNGCAVLALARAARDAGALLVHYGTDFVFDGLASQPYVETDPPHPQSHYALSKLLGEWFAATVPGHYVLRVESLFGGERAKGSIDRILGAIRRGEPASVFTDRTVTPAYVVDVAEATLQVIERRPPAGVYHCVNSGVTTWLGIGEELVRLLRREATLIPTSVDSVTFRAKRPKYCALSNDKLRLAGIEMPSWQDALARYVKKL